VASYETLRIPAFSNADTAATSRASSSFRPRFSNAGAVGLRLRWIAKDPLDTCETLAHPRHSSTPASPRAGRAADDRGESAGVWRDVGATAVAGKGRVVVKCAISQIRPAGYVIFQLARLAALI
jgi:hypothetical protein